MNGRKFTAASFTITPDWVIDLLPPKSRAQCAVVWHVIARHADRTTRECWPSRKTIAELAGCSPETVKRAVHELERIGALERRGQRNGGDGAWGTQMYVMHFDIPPPF